MASLLFRPWRLLALASICFSATGMAQSALYVEHHGQMKLVRSARTDRPYIEENGKLVPAGSHRYELKAVDDYLPVFVSIDHLEVRTLAAESIDDATTSNSLFEFHAVFSSAYTLGDVFVLLEFNQPSGVKSFFLREIGPIEPNKPQRRRFQVLIDHPLTDYKYILHLFVGGAEVLQSTLSPDYRESVLERMVGQRIAGRPDGPPAPFIGPPPVYPPKLAEAKVRGQAVLRLHILANGKVVDPVIVKATDPAFGSAAVDSMRQWRFLPRISHGHAVDTVVNVPVDFAPPEPAAEKS